MPVSDCAPLVVAQEHGWFSRFGLDVELQRESSWASLRDKVISGDLDAVHAPATLPFLANLGLESDPCACVSGLVLSLGGNSIVVSRRLWEAGVHDATTLREGIYRKWGKATYTFGVSFQYSPQHLLLRSWLLSAGIGPETEVRIIAIPPDQLFPTLKLGYIDGFCGGEPWTTLAVQAGAGYRLAANGVLGQRHPEKVLVVRQSFSAGRREEHDRLVAALVEACRFCDQPENAALLSHLLAHPQYLNAPQECVEAGFAGPAESGNALGGLSVFFRDGANVPEDCKSSWLIEQLYSAMGQSVFTSREWVRAPMLKNIFRRDLYERATSLLVSPGDGCDARSLKPLAPLAALAGMDS